MTSSRVKDAMGTVGVALASLGELTPREMLEMADEMERRDSRALGRMGPVPEEVRAPNLAIARLLRWLAEPYEEEEEEEEEEVPTATRYVV